MNKISIKKRPDGRMDAAGKQEFIKTWEGLKEGQYEMIIRRVTTGRSRYAYYFDCVLFNILIQAGHFFRLAGGMDIKTEEQLHMVMKMKYNPVEVIDTVSGEIMTVPFTTTELTDHDFIEKYEQQIIADFSGPPYLVEVPTFNHYKEMRVNGTWDNYKRGIEACRVRYNESPTEV